MTSLASQTAGRDFDSALLGALQAVEQEDADGYGISNLEEIVLGTNPRWALGEYDVEFAMRRVTALYCGQSPTYEQLQGLRSMDELAAQRAELHRVLDECLASEWWTTVGVAELADPKIRPVRAVGIDTEVYFGSFRLVLGGRCAGLRYGAPPQQRGAARVPAAARKQVYGGVDPETTLTFGYDPSTGKADKGQVQREGDVYSVIAQALDIEFLGRRDSVVVRT